MENEEWTKEDWNKLNNLAVQKSSSILDSAEHPYFALRTLGTALLINSGLFFTLLFLPKIILFFIGVPLNTPKDELFVYYGIFIIAVFCCGFFISYSAYKLFQINFAKPQLTKINSGFMSGYSDADERNRNWKIWFLSALGGVLNILLIFSLVELIESFLK